MSDKALEKLIGGYLEFREEYIGDEHAAYRACASKGQKPQVMMIACSDSRVNPAILTKAGLGEIFIVNNVANLVPPYKQGKDTHHSTSAALEFALTSLKIENIIVLGHSGCGGIKALMRDMTHSDLETYSFIAPWMDIASEAKTNVLKKYADCSAAEKTTYCEKESLLISLNNLKTFPWVRDAIAGGNLNIHAWYFDVKSGDIEQYSSEKECFVPLVIS